MTGVIHEYNFHHLKKYLPIAFMVVIFVINSISLGINFQTANNRLTENSINLLLKTSQIVSSRFFIISVILEVFQNDFKVKIIKSIKLSYYLK